MDILKKTPLYQMHKDMGAKLMDFNGWIMPLQYSGIIKEHDAVRKYAGLFDVSHMGEIECKGKNAARFLQGMVTNDISRLRINQVQYAFMCYEKGGTVDDILIYRLGHEHFILVVNASNTEKDLGWLKEHCTNDTEIRDISDETAQLAIQGPYAQKILQQLTKHDLGQIRFFRCNDGITVDGVECLVSRTGYTGEDGFEIYLRPEYAERLWDNILNAGENNGLMPAGLGCRDTLRLEAGLPLYGHELSQDITPLEAGFLNFVIFNKEEFIGKQSLYHQYKKGTARKLIGFEMMDRGVPRNGYKIVVDNDQNNVQIGNVTSGGFCPAIKNNAGIALVESRYAEPGRLVHINIRDRILRAVLKEIPFYKKNYKKSGGF